jgi:LmbE family N-acetylglucosaminyl deacetylase
MQINRALLSILKGVFLSALLFLFIAPQAVRAQGKTVIVFAPHPDDEALCCSGIIYAAKQRGDTVKVVVVTNGDFQSSVSFGQQREGETVAGMAVLGLSEQDVIFLGYGDQTLQTLYQSSSPSTVVTSSIGQTHTYGNRGLGRMDYHTFLTGLPGPYNRQTILGDVEAVLQNFKPDEVYTTSLWDSHPDHRGTFTFVVEALLALKKSGVSLSTRVHETIIHEPCATCSLTGYRWPNPPFTPSQPFFAPPFLVTNATYQWNQIEAIPTPATMRDPNFSSNMKARVITQYPSQGGGTGQTNWLFSFVKEDEFFWDRDFTTNLAGLATVTVSSQDPADGSLGISAVDGVIDGATDYNPWEWNTNGTLNGSWIQLNWASPVTISHIALYSRPSGSDTIVSGTVSFSDSSTIPVGQLPSNSYGLLASFAPKTVTSVRFTVDNATGITTGLAEIETYGKFASDTGNHPPQIWMGPVAVSTTITDAQTTSLNVSAFDVDANTLSYSWTSDMGTVTGSGPNAVFTPPVVAAQTDAAITVTVSDGQGGTIQNTTYVTVTPSNSSSLAVSSVALNPTSVVSGSSSTGTVTLTSVAPNGAVVSVSSSNTSIATTPVNAVASPGSNTANFLINTTFVASTTPVTISGSLRGVTQNATLTVLKPPVTLSSLTVNPSTVGGGGPSATGTVTLSGPALAGGSVISLSSNLPSVVTMPATVTVPAGSTGATFSITTQAVTSPVQVTLSATFVGATNTTSLRVSPYVSPNLATLATISVSSENTTTGQLGIKAIDGIVDGTPGDFTKEWVTNGQLAGAWIRLTWTGPVTISRVVLYDRPNLTDNITSGTLSFSDSSTVPVGALQNDGSPLTVGFAPKTVTWMQFTVNTAVGQNIGLAEIAVTGSAASVLTGVTLNPEIATGGAVVTGTVTLNVGAPAGGAVVTLSGNNSAAALVDPSVTVPTGATSANFNVVTNTVTNVSAVTVTGTYTTSQSANLAVNPAGVVATTVWTPEVTPTTADNGPGTPIEVGVRFNSDADGYVLGVRFYKGPLNTGTHVGNLWTTSGQLLATATFTGETASGWQQVIFSSPVHITANTNYIASYHSSTGDYAVDPFWFEAGTPTDSAPLHLPGDQPGGPNGVFANGAVSTFPNASNNASNYWVDIVFDAAPTTLSISTQLLPDGYQGGFYFQPLRANGGTQPYGWSLVSGNLPNGLSLSSNGIIDGIPTAAGTFNFTLQATDSGTVPQNVQQLFGLTIAPAGGCPCAVWAPGTLPTTADNGATIPIELGMRFQADSDGFIIAIQFYKGTLNAGPHTVNLWTSGGQLLSTATSTAETSSGWQLVSLPSPVHITANTPYVASYHSSTGDFAVDPLWFAFGTPSDNAPLHAPGDTPSTPNGVFANGTTSTFPNTSSNASNYWVDITYDPVPGPSLASLAVNPSSAKGTATGTVTISGPAPQGGEVVNLSSSYSPLVTVPATVTVPLGATSTTFPITIVPVPSPVGVTITATGNGIQTANMTALPPSLTAVSVNPTSVPGGAPSTGTVTLDSPASVLGVAVTLSSGNAAAATVPPSVTIASGSTTATFTVTTHGVGSSTPVVISATADVTQTATLTVNPPSLVSLSLNPPSVVGGTFTSTGTVTLTGPAPTGGAVVGLTSDNAAATVPANVTVPTGATTATFTVSTTTVTVTVMATITGTYNSIQQHGSLLVTPAGGGGMVEYAADSFNRANGPLGPNWTTTLDADSAPAIASQQVRTSGGRAKALYYGGINWPADQYAQGQIIASFGNGSTGPTVRMTSNGNFYAGTVGSFGVGNANVFILLDNNGSTSVIASSTTATVLANDYVQLAVQGSLLTLTDVTRSTTLLSVSNSTIPVGYPGIYVSDGPLPTLANWSAGVATAPVILTTLASDNFNRPNAPSLGSSWTVGPGYFTIQIVNDQIESDGQGQPPGQGHGKEFYSAVTFPSDQWSQAQVIASNNDVNGAIVRYQGTVDTHYVGFVSRIGPPGTCTVTIDRDISGAPTVLASDSTYCAVASGDYIRLQAQETLLSYIDVTTGSLLLTTMDSQITGGSPGWSLNPNGSTPRAANWSGGEFTGNGSI